MPDENCTNELAEALRVIASLIRNCEKMQVTFAKGTPQHTLLINRIEALNIANHLIMQDDTAQKYERDELTRALRPVTSILSKCEKAQGKCAAGTAQHTRLKKIINAMTIAKERIIASLEK